MKNKSALLFKSHRLVKFVPALGALLLLSMSACSQGTGTGINKTAGGALTGAALGAGTGAIIGSATGKTGPGIAIGAALGSVGGALLGNQMDNQDQQRNQVYEQQLRQQEEIDRQRREIEELRRQRGYDSPSGGSYNDPYYRKNDPYQPSTQDPNQHPNQQRYDDTYRRY